MFEDMETDTHKLLSAVGAAAYSSSGSAKHRKAVASATREAAHINASAIAFMRHPNRKGEPEGSPVGAHWEEGARCSGL